MLTASLWTLILWRSFIIMKEHFESIIAMCCLLNDIIITHSYFLAVLQSFCERKFHGKNLPRFQSRYVENYRTESLSPPHRTWKLNRCWSKSTGLSVYTWEVETCCFNNFFTHPLFRTSWVSSLIFETYCRAFPSWKISWSSTYWMWLKFNSVNFCWSRSPVMIH